MDGGQLNRWFLLVLLLLGACAEVGTQDLADAGIGFGSTIPVSEPFAMAGGAAPAPVTPVPRPMATPGPAADGGSQPDSGGADAGSASGSSDGGTSGAGGSAGSAGAGGSAGAMGTTDPPPLLPPASTPADRIASPDNPPECPAEAPENPVGDCLGLPVYVQCTYGSYVCLCDWYHWLCAG